MLLLSMLLPGCYYMQAASGQWEVMRKKEPVDAIIEDPDTAPELAARLRLLHEAREFSVAELGLPNNDSYRSYTQLQRDYVVWNVFAAPEFSLQPKQWCFPVAGCVSYRGYFSKDAALRKSERLAKAGYDVAVGGVAAYSTLGKFSDPILSTMMRWDDTDLVAVMFHELAHQVVYIKGDTTFNESFATAVEEIGIQKWLISRHEEHKVLEYLAGRDLQQRLLLLVEKARADLEPVYEADMAVEKKRALKRERLATLAETAAAEIQSRGGDASGWLSGELNNARLISTTLYEGYLPAFRAIYANCERNIQCFYSDVKKLAALGSAERAAELSARDPLSLGVHQG